MNILIKNANIVLKNKILKNYCLYIENNKIEKIAKKIKYNYIKKVIDANNNYIIPGFIDLHIHGANGYDIMDGNKKSIEEISKFILKKGVTSFLPTLITESNEKIYKALNCIASFNKKGVNRSNILGVHMEGPFFSHSFKGAQNPNYIKCASIEQTKKYIEKHQNLIKIFTLAPEVVSKEVIDYLVENDVIVALGHSSATSEEVHIAVRYGISHAVHIFNGMKGIHHREPGTAGGILLNNNIKAEVIFDKVHLHPDIIKLVIKCKGISNTIFVSDSIKATGLPDGIYSLGGLKVIVKNSVARTQDGSLAGSTLTMDIAFKNAISILNLSIIDAVKLTSTNAAKELNLSSKGNIEEGYDADIILYDKNNFSIKHIILDGKIIQ